MTQTLGVTGATGYIGRAVVANAAAHGWQVISLGRCAAPGTIGHRHADLAQRPSDDLLDGLHAVLHLAAVTVDQNVGAQAEIDFAQALAQQAATRRQRLIVVSSQTASSSAPSPYGRTKTAIEAVVQPLGAVLVRPGLVYGGDASGLFGLLAALVQRAPLLPDLRPRPRVQPVHVDDLVTALFAALGKSDVDGQPLTGQTLAIAGRAVSLQAFLAGVARHRLRVRRMWIPVPVAGVRGLLHVAGRVDARFAAERLDSLTQLPMLDTQADAQRLGVVLRKLDDGLTRRGCPDRRLLEEARALSRALFGSMVHAPAGLLRRYARAVRAGGDVALDIPSALLDRPSWLAALDTPCARRGGPMADLAARMTLLSRLSESEPALVDAFVLRTSRAGVLATGWHLTTAGLLELRARAVARLARAARGCRE